MSARKPKRSTSKEKRSATQNADGDQGDAGAGERKDKVLHARIPESLDREIKHRAQNLGLSVSTVVRHVLLHTFDLVEDIVSDSTNIALSIAGGETRRADRERDRRRSTVDPISPDAEVLGWQEAILNKNAVCARCNAILAKGTAAAIGICETSGPQAILCSTCVDEVTGRRGGDPSPSSASAGEEVPERVRRAGKAKR